jgi:hypothetical protein
MQGEERQMVQPTPTPRWQSRTLVKSLLEAESRRVQLQAFQNR